MACSRRLTKLNLILSTFQPRLYRPFFSDASCFFFQTTSSLFRRSLLHATSNSVSAGLIFPLFSGKALILLWWIYSLLWLGIGLALLLFSHPNAATSDL